MHEQLYYHSNMNIIQKGCEPPRAYFIPFSSRAEAVENNRETSKYFCLLNGEWDFCYFESVSDIVSLSGVFNEKINVPSCWQNTLKYDKPLYLNVSYPFTVNPPFVTGKNPCAIYRREFDVSRETLEKKEVFLNFEGVCSCFYLWINGEYLAYSQGSHMTTEINITQKLEEGKNEIKVLVLKFCDGSYLEDQDMFRLSGIFRDVYLLYRDKNCIKDIKITYSLNSDFTKADVTLDIKGSEEVQKNILLYSYNGDTLIYSTLSTENSLSFSVVDPKLWSAEIPNLYTLLIECGNEVIAQRIGFWSIEIKDEVLYFNTEKIKIKGVNHHENNPFTGYYLSYQAMREDLYIMKCHNINAVRTSHYPPAPQFLELCSELGLYVIDEADLETHGFSFSHGDPSFLSKRQEWENAFIDRAVRMYERDKNHTCILMWSLGNESGFGENHREMANILRKLETKSDGKRQRLIHYEGDNIYFNKDNHESDVGSAMYLPYNEFDKVLRDKDYLKPFILCEYSHAMGNSCGDINEYMDWFYSDDRLLGGCVWEFADHSIAEKSEDNKIKLLYGGDFDEGLNDGNFCIDGLVTPLRTPKTSLLAVKQAYKPFEIIKNEDTYSIKNRNLFAPLDISLKWVLKCNGEKIKSGKETVIIKPSSFINIIIPSEQVNGETILSISVLNNIKTPWAEIGHELGKTEFILSSEQAKQEHKLSDKKIRFEENIRYFRITANKIVYIFDKDFGSLRCIRIGKEDVVSSLFEMCASRAPIDNDRNIVAKWEEYGLFDAQQQCEFCDYEKNDESVIIKARLMLGGRGKAPILFANVFYKFNNSGIINIKYDVNVSNHIEWLPRFGITFEMPKEYEKARYYGYGPEETYIDKHDYCFLGIYEKQLNKKPLYVKPQQSNDVYGTRWTSIIDRRGHGIKIYSDSPFSFRASRYSQKQLSSKRHRYELQEEENVFVNIDYKMSGTGSASCGPELLEKYRLTEKEFSFEFNISIE